MPSRPGIYAWFFDAVPPLVPQEGCGRLGDWTLLYVGISPKEPPKNGARPSAQHLRKRIGTHFAGNAEGSTLRRTLGILLAQETGFPLRRVGSGGRMTFTHAGEQILDAWLDQHARVCWIEDSQPWVTEEQLIATLSLPLNLRGNEHHPFFPSLSKMRSQALEAARQFPIAPEGGQTRKILK